MCSGCKNERKSFKIVAFDSLLFWELMGITLIMVPLLLCAITKASLPWLYFLVIALLKIFCISSSLRPFDITRSLPNIVLSSSPNLKKLQQAANVIWFLRPIGAGLSTTNRRDDICLRGDSRTLGTTCSVIGFISSPSPTETTSLQG
jgi:hypothetical protein